MEKDTAANHWKALILQADFQDLEDIQNVLRIRYAELFPDWDIVYLALPKGDPQARKSHLELAIKHLQE